MYLIDLSVFMYGLRFFHIQTKNAICFHFSMFLCSVFGFRFARNYFVWFVCLSVRAHDERAFSNLPLHFSAYLLCSHYKPHIHTLTIVLSLFPVRAFPPLSLSAVSFTLFLFLYFDCVTFPFSVFPAWNKSCTLCFPAIDFLPAMCREL